MTEHKRYRFDQSVLIERLQAWDEQCVDRCGDKPDLSRSYSFIADWLDVTCKNGNTEYDVSVIHTAALLLVILLDAMDDFDHEPTKDTYERIMHTVVYYLEGSKG